MILDPTKRRARNQAAVKRWRLRHPEQQRAIMARSNRRTVLRQHGITEDQYQAILASQNGVCAICNNPTAYCKGGNLGVDHDHTTGDIRGLLCTSCNAGLGHFKDNPGILHRAIEYLRCS